MKLLIFGNELAMKEEEVSRMIPESLVYITI